MRATPSPELMQQKRLGRHYPVGTQFRPIETQNRSRMGADAAHK